MDELCDTEFNEIPQEDDYIEFKMGHMSSLIDIIETMGYLECERDESLHSKIKEQLVLENPKQQNDVISDFVEEMLNEE